MITNRQRAQIRNFAKTKPIELFYLFGSRARGEEKPLSDYDFAILFAVSLSDRGRSHLKLEAISFLSKLLETDSVDILDLNVATADLRYAAISNRGDIYTRSEDSRVTFELKAMQEYFDQMYYIKRHTLQSLETISREGLS